MKVTKEIVLSLFLLASVLIVPYVLTKLFRSTPKENFQAKNPLVVNTTIRGITKAHAQPQVEQKTQEAFVSQREEVVGVYETSEEFQDIGQPAGGAAPTSVSAAATAVPMIATPSESSIPAPQRGSVERTPMANPYVATPDTDSVHTALQPEITTPTGAMTVSSFVSGPAPFS